MKMSWLLFAIGLIIIELWAGVFSVSSDPDLGWHLKYGEEIWLTHKIPKVDTFTYTVAGIPWESGDWLVEVVEYKIHEKFGLLGLSVLSAIILSLAVVVPLLLFQTNTNKLISFVAVTLTLLVSRSVFAAGMRVQIAGLCLLSISVSLLWKFIFSEKVRYLYPLPILMLIWANSHSSYLLGLAVIEMVMFLYYIQRKKYLYQLLIIGLLCGSSYILFHSAIINFSSVILLVKGIFSPIVKTTIDSGIDVRQTIAEWLPIHLPSISGLGYGLLLLWGVSILLLVPHKIITWSQIFLVFFFIYTSSLYSRNIPFLGFALTPMLIWYSPLLWEKTMKINVWSKIGALIVVGFIIMISKTAGNNVVRVIKASNGKDLYCQTDSPPCRATEYLVTHPLKGNMYNFYDWGGYLIWKLPEYKVFIDGRMAGSELFREYQQLQMVEDGWEDVLTKYELQWVILPQDMVLNKVLIEDKGWTTYYEDERAVVLVSK